MSLHVRQTGHSEQHNAGNKRKLSDRRETDQGDLDGREPTAPSKAEDSKRGNPALPSLDIPQSSTARSEGPSSFRVIKPIIFKIQ